MRTRRIRSVIALAATALALAGCATAGDSGASPETGTVVGTWQSGGDDAPHLVFSADGKYSGNDGCNSLSGRYTQDGETVTVTMSAGTARACPGVDTWLSRLATVTVADDALEVYDASGDLLGSLARSE